MLPLEDIRIVDYGNTSMSAHCGRLLADAGADVIKVEPTTGDPARMRGPFPDDIPDPERSGLFLLTNVNKRGMCLDLDGLDQRATFARLLEWADVLVTDLSPLKARSLGLTWRRLHRLHPRLIYASITPFGERGPYRDYLANDHVIYNMGGLAYATPGLPDHVDDPSKEPPLRPSTPIAELIAGTVGAISTLLALQLRQRDGKGRRIEVSAQEAVASVLTRDVASYAYRRLITGRRPVEAARMPNLVMPCKDGFVLLAIPYNHMWKSLVGLMGNPDWAELEVFQDSLSRAANWDALYPLLLEWTTQYSGEEIMQMTQNVGLPCFSAFTLSSVVDSDHERDRGYFWSAPVSGNKTAKVPGSPFILSETPLHMRRAAPKLGEHSEEILDQIDAVVNKGESNKGWDKTLPLEGIRIIDFGQFVSIPFCSQILGWMGAEVIVVETRERALMRGSPPFVLGRPQTPNTASFNYVGTNKMSLTLNVADPQGLLAVKKLVGLSDVVLENFATGTIERLGLGYSELRKIRPDIIMLSLGGFGRKGAMAHYAALHSGVNMASGMTMMTGFPGGRPRLLGSFAPDTISGLYACLAVIEALYHREKTGWGQYIDLSMTEVLSHFMPEAVFDYVVNGREPEFLGNRDRVHAPQGIYSCRGWDAWIGVSITTKAQWKALCRVMKWPDLAEDTLLDTSEGRHARHDEIDSAITQWTRRLPREEAVRLLQVAGVPAGPSFNAKDLLNDPHLKARGFVRSVDHPEAGRRRLLGVPWRISDMKSVKINRPPLLGEHTLELLGGLAGLLPDEVQGLVDRGVIK